MTDKPTQFSRFNKIKTESAEAANVAFARLKQLSNGREVKFLCYAISICLIIGLIYFIYNKRKLNKANCRVLAKVYSSKPTLNAVVNTEYKNHALRDFYVKTAYNCCSSGQFKNDFVNLCALKTCIEQGVRCLDFEIYSINNEPVVAASSVNDFTIKETYNSIPINQVFTTIMNTAFSNGICPNADDPLILHFRIMSKNIPMYNKLANQISKSLSSRTLGKLYSFENQGANLGIVPVSTLKGKIVIIIDATNPLYQSVPALDEWVNLASGAPFMYTLRYKSVKYTQDLKLKDFNKKQMTIVLPDLMTNDTNPNFNIARQYGCQFIAMSFQNYDSNLEHYNAFFDGEKTAFVLKPAALRYIPVRIKKPPPVPPEYSYATRPIKSEYYNYSI